MLHAGGSTALHNAIYIALKELKKVQTTPSEENPRRQALVVFSDGQDTSSLIPYEEVLDLAKRSETAIYTIGLRDAQDQVRGFSQRGIRAAPARPRNRRTLVLPEQHRPIWPGSTGRSPTSSPASTRSATARRTRATTAPGAASSCR